MRDYEIVVEGNNFKGSGSDELVFYGYGATGKYLIKNNVIDSAGVYIQGSKKALIQGNTIKNATSTSTEGIYIYNTSAVVENNTITGHRGNGVYLYTYSGYEDVAIDTVRNNIITGNNTYGSSYYAGILVGGYGNHVIWYNDIYDNAENYFITGDRSMGGHYPKEEQKEFIPGTHDEQHKRLGVSADWTRKNFTLNEGPSNAVRNTFVNLFNKGLIYRGERIINWCPRCATALSDLEVDYQEEIASPDGSPIGSHDYLLFSCGSEL